MASVAATWAHAAVRIVFIAGAALAVFWLSAERRSLRAAEGDGAIAAIVQTGWSKEAGSLDKAIALHKRAGAAAPGDWRTDYAMALVYFQHRRFAEAQKSLQEAARLAPDQPPAIEALLWLETYQRQYDVLLAHMRTAAEMLAERGSSAVDGDPDPQAIRMARLMGQLIGYLTGPAKENLAGDAVEACRREVSEKLPRELIEPFEEGEQQIDDQFVAAQEELVTARDEDAANQARKKEEELARIAEEREKLAKLDETLKEEETKATEEKDRELASIDKQIPDLQQRANEVRSLAAPMERLINEAQFRQSRQIAAANSSRDEVVRDAAFREADRLQFFINRERARLEPLEREAGNIAAQLQRLALARSQQEARWQNRMAAAAAQRQKAEKTLKILDRKERDLADDGRSSSARTRAQAAKLSALTSYVKFPLEESKAALLKDLGK